MGTQLPTRPRKTFQGLKKKVDTQLKQKTQPKTENDAIPVSLSPRHPHCSCARKAKTHQGGGRLRQRVRSGRAGVQQGQGGRQVVQDRRRRRRQDLLPPVLQGQDQHRGAILRQCGGLHPLEERGGHGQVLQHGHVEQPERDDPDLQGGHSGVLQLDDQGLDEGGGEGGGSAGLHALHTKRSQSGSWFCMFQVTGLYQQIVLFIILRILSFISWVKYI